MRFMITFNHIDGEWERLTAKEQEEHGAWLKDFIGELQAKKAVPVLLKTVQNLDNASSTREQAAIALGKIADKRCLPELKKIAEEYPELMTRRALLESVVRMSR